MLLYWSPSISDLTLDLGKKRISPGVGHILGIWFCPHKLLIFREKVLIGRFYLSVRDCYGILYQPVIGFRPNILLKNPKVYSPFVDDIWGADLADMQLFSKFNKGIRFLLCGVLLMFLVNVLGLFL